MKKMSFSKMVLVLAMVSAGTMMRAQEGSTAAEGLIASANTESLDYLKSAGSKVVSRSFTRNRISYDIIEQSGKMSMYQADGVFTVSYVNDTKKKVAFSLQDRQGNIVYSLSNKKNMFHKRFSTKKLPAGRYTAVIVSTDDYFEKEFLIN